MKRGGLKLAVAGSGPTLAVPSQDSAIGKFLTHSGTFKDGELLVNKDGLRTVSHSNAGEDPPIVIKPLDNNLSLAGLDSIKVIGKGNGGIVQLVRHKWTGQFFALKVIQLNIQESIRKQIAQELKIGLSTTQCPNVVVCYQCFYDNGVISIVLEYMDGGSLADFLKIVKTIPEAYLAAICKQVLKGLIYLHHEKHIIHRDLKPSNILINHRGEVKISDFGVSAIIASSSGQRDTFTGTYNYMAVRLDGYKWSTPFSIESDGVMCISLNSLIENDKIFIRVQVRIGAKSSCYEVLFQLASLSSPYRIENRSMYLPLRFRQVDGYDDSWHILPPNSASLFFWEDLGRNRMLELMVDGSDTSTSYKYSLDEASDCIPSSSRSGPWKPLRVTVFKEGKVQVNRVTDWMPETGSQPQAIERVTSPIFQPSEIEYGQSSVGPESEVHMSFELAELGLSIVDHMPEEILYLSVQKLFVSYSSGMGSGISRFKARMYWLQVDNQLPFSPMPVLFSPLRVENQPDYLIKLSITTQANNSLDLCVYPYIGLQAPENSSFLVNIHEPIIWRLHDMIQHVNIGRLSKSQTAAVSVDPMIKIGLLNISEIRFRVSMAMSPAQRPRGVLGFWASLMTALGNMEHMPVRIAQRFREDVSMRQSALTSAAFSNIQKDLLTQPLQLLSGVDILGNASSALSNMSKGIAALSMDKKFIQSRQKQDSKGVEDISDVIKEGGGALAKGFFRGVTGILTKPLEGAKATGVEGFVSGVGKGLIGAAAQPVSGVLDLLSKTTEGANAVKNKISSAIMAEQQLSRRRLPRAIGGDNLLCPYDEHKAAGETILQLAECGTFLSQVDLFKVRGKFAFTDAYEDHYFLPKGKILLVTHHRVLLLQQPTLTQRKFNPGKDPCTVLWEVPWDELVTMGLTKGKKDPPGSLPSHLILYLRMKPNDSKEAFRTIKCTPASEQATNIYVSIQQALDTYGPSSSKDLLRRKVPKPYNPRGASSSELFPKEVFGASSDSLDPSLVMVHGQPIPVICAE